MSAATIGTVRPTPASRRGKGVGVGHGGSDCGPTFEVLVSIDEHGREVWQPTHAPKLGDGGGRRPADVCAPECDPWSAPAEGCRAPWRHAHYVAKGAASGMPKGMPVKWREVLAALRREFRGLAGWRFVDGVLEVAREGEGWREFTTPADALAYLGGPVGAPAPAASSTASAGPRRARRKAAPIDHYAVREDETAAEAVARVLKVDAALAHAEAVDAAPAVEAVAAPVVPDVAPEAASVAVSGCAGELPAWAVEWLGRLVYGAKRDWCAAYVAHLVHGAPAPADVEGAAWCTKARKRADWLHRAATAAA